MNHPLVHPSRTKPLQIGAIAGIPVWSTVTGNGGRPECPAGGMGCGPAIWHALGAAPWVADVRAIRLRQWLDPVGSPWSRADLVGVLAEAGLYDIQESDWPPECPPTGCPLGDAHWDIHLPAAVRAACERYVAQVSP